MTPLSNLVYALALVVDVAINLMYLLLLARVVLSWVQPRLSHPLVQALYAITEPVLLPIRRQLQRLTGPTPIDWSPLAAFLGLLFLQAFLVRTLYQLAHALQI